MTINISGYAVIIDDEDYGRVMAAGTWHFAGTRKYPYFAHIGPRPDCKVITLHRFLMGFPAGLCVDHANMDTLDNRKSNLRVCTKSQNQQNRHKVPGYKSNYKGVSRSSASSIRWKARLKINHHTINLGSFNTEEAAHAAYCIAAKKYHGEYARLV